MTPRQFIDTNSSTRQLIDGQVIDGQLNDETIHRRDGTIRRRTIHRRDNSATGQFIDETIDDQTKSTKSN